MKEFSLCCDEFSGSSSCKCLDYLFLFHLCFFLGKNQSSLRDPGFCAPKVNRTREPLKCVSWRRLRREVNRCRVHSIMHTIVGLGDQRSRVYYLVILFLQFCSVFVVATSREESCVLREGILSVCFSRRRTNEDMYAGCPV